MNPLHEYLQPGESPLWEGQPDAARFARSGLVFAVPFGCVFTGFSLFWMGFSFTLTRGVGEALPSVGPVSLFPLFGLPFVLIGLYMLVGRLPVAASQARNTWYGVTDRRVLILSGPRRSLTELALGGIAAMQVDERGDGYGTIAFGPTMSTSSLPGMSGSPAYIGGTRYQPAVPAFQAIPHVRSVYDTIKGAQARSSGEDEGPFRREETPWDAPPRWPGRGGV